jgi:hypothetical protein
MATSPLRQFDRLIQPDTKGSVRCLSLHLEYYTKVHIRQVRFTVKRVGKIFEKNAIVWNRPRYCETLRFVQLDRAFSLP